MNQQMPESFQYVSLLEHASEGVLRFPHSEEYMEWAIQSLFTHLKPTHVSIALYNSELDVFSIKFSNGRYRIPSGFLSFDKHSALVQQLIHADLSKEGVRQFNKPVAFRSFESHIKSDANNPLWRELELHRVEVCAKIDTHDRLSGYLLIGPKEDKTPYTEGDLFYFQAIANDIAIGIEREQFYRSANYDPLTELLNRQSLTPRYTKMKQKADEVGRGFALVMIDIDNFKAINDKYGHLGGDQVLRIVAQILRHNLRQTDLAFRFGGEEILLLIEINPRNSGLPVSQERLRFDVLQTMERLRAKIAERPIQYLDHSIPVTISLGAAFYDPKCGKPIEPILDEADKALYVSKKTGKNKVTLQKKDNHILAKAAV